MPFSISSPCRHHVGILSGYGSMSIHLIADTPNLVSPPRCHIEQRIQRARRRRPPITLEATAAPTRPTERNKLARDNKKAAALRKPRMLPQQGALRSVRTSCPPPPRSTALPTAPVAPRFDATESCRHHALPTEEPRVLVRSARSPRKIFDIPSIDLKQLMVDSELARHSNAGTAQLQLAFISLQPIEDEPTVDHEGLEACQR